VSHIIDSYDLKASEKDGEIILESDNTETTISADKHHFENLMFNLLDNAIKYCISRPMVTISTQEKDRKVILSVEDNGIGIEPAYQKKVFSKFFRVPTGDIHNVKGFGLGLDYVKNIVVAHGWKIYLDSELDMGSKFIITIPIKS